MNLRRYKSILICFLFAVILCSCNTFNEQDSIGNVQPSTGENVDSIDGKDELLPSSHSDQMIFVSTEEMIQEILGFEPIHTDIMNFSESDYEDWLDYYSSIVYTNINAYDIGYYLSYLDGDDIPELIECVGALEASFVWSWKTPGEFSEMPRTFAYNERSGRILSKNTYFYTEQNSDYLYYGRYDGDSGYEMCEYYNADHEGSYKVFDVSVDKDNYSVLTDIFDMDNLIKCDYSHSYSSLEIIYIMKTGHDSSYNHRYEIFYDDLSWEEAREKCTEKGGYLATITSTEELNLLSELLSENESNESAFYIGYRRFNGSEHGECVCLNDGRYLHAEYQDKFRIRYPDHSYFKKFYGDYSNGDLLYGLFCYCDSDVNGTQNGGSELVYGPENLAKYNPEMSGRVGYICEYDE